MYYLPGEKSHTIPELSGGRQEICDFTYNPYWDRFGMNEISDKPHISWMAAKN